MRLSFVTLACAALLAAPAWAEDKPAAPQAVVPPKPAPIQIQGNTSMTGDKFIVRPLDQLGVAEKKQPKPATKN